MEQTKLDELIDFCQLNITDFHNSRLNRLQDLKLNQILKKKNPYLFKAKNITIASDLIEQILDAYLSSSEEKFFGDFLEKVAIFTASIFYGGKKSAATGLDLEFNKDSIQYLISIKSGPNWGNSSQYRRLEDDFKKAEKVLKQANSKAHIQSVLGICYGKSKDSYARGYLKTMGQKFWYLISGDIDLYQDIIEPIGFKTKEHNDDFLKEKGKLINNFSKQFLEDFCTDGLIEWPKLVKFNSGNIK